jgi:hypothetical protein
MDHRVSTAHRSDFLIRSRAPHLRTSSQSETFASWRLGVRSLSDWRLGVSSLFLWRLGRWAMAAFHCEDAGLNLGWETRTIC